jgi:hypothetical protein
VFGAGAQVGTQLVVDADIVGTEMVSILSVWARTRPVSAWAAFSAVWARAAAYWTNRAPRPTWSGAITGHLRAVSEGELSFYSESPRRATGDGGSDRTPYGGVDTPRWELVNGRGHETAC